MAVQRRKQQAIVISVHKGILLESRTKAVLNLVENYERQLSAVKQAAFTEMQVLVNSMYSWWQLLPGVFTCSLALRTAVAGVAPASRSQHGQVCAQVCLYTRS